MNVKTKKIQNQSDPTNAFCILPHNLEQDKDYVLIHLAEITSKNNTKFCEFIHISENFIYTFYEPDVRFCVKNIHGQPYMDIDLFKDMISIDQVAKISRVVFTIADDPVSSDSTYSMSSTDTNHGFTIPLFGYSNNQEYSDKFNEIIYNNRLNGWLSDSMQKWRKEQKEKVERN